LVIGVKGVRMTHDPSSPAIRPATADDAPAIRLVLFSALDAGELRGTMPRDLEHLLDRITLGPSSMLVSVVGDEVTGFFDPHYPLLTVHSRYRRQRHGTLLVERALVDARERGETEVELAPPLGSGPAEAFAASMGFAYRSSLWQLRLGPEVAVPPSSFPAGYHPRAFEPGPDDESYLTLITVSFADHPTPMHLSMEMMQQVHARPDFDPTEIAVVPAPDDASRLVGFCRTHLVDSDGERYAEIGTLGVLPEFRGLGLGRELLRWGIHSLRSRGAGDIVLAVEGRNANALRLYERTGFVQEQEWPRWASPVSGTTSRM
jgi:mycothiol synthase